MKSTIYRFGLLGGLALVAVGCGDDDGTQCGAGTVLQNGQCVADNDTGGSDVLDTFIPPDGTSQPDSTSQPDTDATTNPTNPTDTFQPDTSPVQVYEGSLQPLAEGDCSSEQWVDRDVSDGCTMSCQCKEGLECMNIPYYQPGFSFCTRSAASSSPNFPTGSYGEQPYVKANTHTGCYNQVVESKREYFLVKWCNSLDECKSRSAAYTHCGTKGLSWAATTNDTRCRSSSDPNDNGGTVAHGPICIIEGLFPF